MQSLFSAYITPLKLLLHFIQPQKSSEQSLTHVPYKEEALVPTTLHVPDRDVNNIFVIIMFYVGMCVSIF